MKSLLTHPRTIILCRLFLGFILFGAGMSKLYADHAFPGIIGPVWLEERLAEYGLAFFARFVAFSQVLAGFLLLTQRFATLGAIISFPLFLNILMITISLEWRGTPYVNAVFLAMNTYLLIIDYPKFKYIITDEVVENLQLKSVRSRPKQDLLFTAMTFIVLISIPISFFSIYLAWALVAMALLVIVWNQLRKKTGDEETS